MLLPAVSYLAIYYFRIKVLASDNVEDITEEDADDNIEGLQRLIKKYKNDPLKLKKPKDDTSTNDVNKTSTNCKSDHSKSTNRSVQKGIMEPLKS